MKKLILIFVLTFTAILNAGTTQVLNQGIKYLKLGNTLREAGDFESSKEYLDKATKIISKSKDNFWSASADEYFAYYYRDLSKSQNDENKEYFRAMSIAKFESALEKLSKLKRSKSKSTIDKIIQEIHQLKNTEISDYKGLWLKNTYFTYDDKNIKKLPEEISSKVTYLSLARNKFSNFPIEIAKFKSLEYLDLSDNKIKEVPNTIEYLMKLKILKLKSNKLKTLPESISELPNMKYLDISNNSLKSIPDFLAKCKSLEVLDLRKNNIPFEELKKLLQKMPNTQILHEKYVMENATGEIQAEENNE